jgi:hypothetical protein
MGLNRGVGKTGGHLQVFIFEKESEERGKRGLIDGGEKRAPLLVESSTYY